VRSPLQNCCLLLTYESRYNSSTGLYSTDSWESVTNQDRESENVITIQSTNIWMDDRLYTFTEHSLQGNMESLVEPVIPKDTPLVLLEIDLRCFINQTDVDSKVEGIGKAVFDYFLRLRQLEQMAGKGIFISLANTELCRPYDLLGIVDRFRLLNHGMLNHGRYDFVVNGHVPLYISSTGYSMCRDLNRASKDVLLDIQQASLGWTNLPRLLKYPKTANQRPNGLYPEMEANAQTHVRISQAVIREKTTRTGTGGPQNMKPELWNIDWKNLVNLYDPVSGVPRSQ
jgi:hypothetical protein